MLGSYGLVIYSHFVFLSGLYYFDSSITSLFYVHIGLLACLIAIIEFFFQRNKKWKYTDLNRLKNRIHKKITQDEFKALVKQGKKYALFDNYVLDLTWFRHEHPAGSFLIDQNIGKDMGKYFVGSYSMENGVPPYTHSFIAGQILIKLVCGELEETSTPVIVKSQDLNRSNANLRENKDEFHIDKLSNIFYVNSKTELIPNVFRFKLINNSSNVMSFYPDLDHSGRSYIIRSMQTELCRYYTICNCMNSRFYNRYINLFKFIMGEIPNFNPVDYYEMITEVDDYIEIVAKYYSQSKKGMSSQLTHASPDDSFYVDVPVGKRLDLNFSNMRGHIVLFVGGTGILPYMDFLAYLG